MMMFINNHVDDITGLLVINTCIKEPYKLPFSNIEMPEHKKFFGRVHPLFRGINSDAPVISGDAELDRKRNIVDAMLKKGVKDNIISYGRA